MLNFREMRRLKPVFEYPALFEPRFSSPFRYQPNFASMQTASQLSLLRLAGASLG
jgi:hypothetical protein